MSINANYTLNVIQWYPGHIAKAERNLKEQLKLVDVVLEVRDARIPIVTCHPQLHKWIGSKTRLLILNRWDMISPRVRQLWTEWFKSQGEEPYFTNAQQGQGVAAVSKAAQAAGLAINQRRKSRGMLPRAVRAVVIGFPNVGKSALINRLLGQRVVESAARAGVTRQLRWVRISQDIELLDTPGIIPAKLENQEDALKLAICDDIGEAAYDKQQVAAAFVDIVNQIYSRSSDLFLEHPLRSRYKLDPTSQTGESYLHALAQSHFQGNLERTASRLLQDFRKGLLGAIPLELPPVG